MPTSARLPGASGQWFNIGTADERDAALAALVASAAPQHDTFQGAVECVLDTLLHNVLRDFARQTLWWARHDEIEAYADRIVHALIGDVVVDVSLLALLGLAAHEAAQGNQGENPEAMIAAAYYQAREK